MQKLVLCRFSLNTVYRAYLLMPSSLLKPHLNGMQLFTCHSGVTLLLQVSFNVIQRATT